MKTFEGEYAVPPERAMQEAKPNLTEYVDYLFISETNPHMVCGKRTEYTGSAFEGVKVSNDLEFDIMMIYQLKWDYYRAEKRSTPGYHYVKSMGDGLVPIQSNLAVFFSVLQQRINDHPNMSPLVKLRHHGPAVQMDVYRDAEKKRQNAKWYSVDIVLACEVKLASENKRCIFVAKPLKSDSDAWRISYSLEEKDLFRNMDHDNGCRKQVLRILKAWCYIKTVMNPLTSYHLKTVLLHEVKAETDWSQHNLCLRVNGCLRRLFIALQKEILSHYFIPQLNLLYRLQSNKIQTKTVIENMKNMLDHILYSSESFRDAFNLIQTQITRHKESGAPLKRDTMYTYVYDDNCEGAWTTPTERRFSTLESLTQWSSRYASADVKPSEDDMTSMVAPRRIVARRFSAPEGLAQWSSQYFR